MASRTQKQSTLARIVGLAAAGVATWAAQKAITGAWKAASGHRPPAPDDPDSDAALGEIVLAAALTGAVVAITRVLATRSTARFAHRVDSRRPPLADA